MTNRIKLIWDFRGQNASPIAEHHAKHLSEYVISEGLNNIICSTEQITPLHCIAFLVVEKELMTVLRENLKPHRGQIYTEI